MDTVVLVLNCGGSSIKYKLFNMANESVIAEGNAQGLGSPRAMVFHKVSSMKPVVKEVPINDHQEGLRLILDHFTDFDKNGLICNLESFLIAHKIAHGGHRVAMVEFIDEGVEAAIMEMAVVTPVHNPPMLQGIRAIRAINPGWPQIAYFETGFHHSIPEYATVYGLPIELAENYGLRKYGFHGASHQYISERVPDILGLPAADTRIISIHLGSGTSVAAIKGGKSFDISSGFTPQSGTMMSTRAGDFDPEVLYFLLAKGIFSFEELRQLLNNKAGLAGISGIPGGDIRDLELALQNGNPRAKLAVDAFCYGIKKFIGAFAAVLHGVDVISFTGGIGENNPQIRERICQGMEWMGLYLDKDKNDSTMGTGIISANQSPIQALVLPTDEELVIAKHVYEFWKTRDKS
jgi:acetate kinase